MKKEIHKLSFYHAKTSLGVVKAWEAVDTDGTKYVELECGNTSHALYASGRVYNDTPKLFSTTVHGDMRWFDSRHFVWGEPVYWEYEECWVTPALGVTQHEDVL